VGRGVRWRTQSSFLPPSVTRSRKAPASRLRNSTSAGNAPLHFEHAPLDEICRSTTCGQSDVDYQDGRPRRTLIGCTLTLGRNSASVGYPSLKELEGKMTVAGCCLSNRYWLRNSVEGPRPAYRQTELHGGGSNKVLAPPGWQCRLNSRRSSKVDLHRPCS
jgi:hypothetical protein